MASQPDIITTDLPALSAGDLPDQLRAFVARPWDYRRRYLQQAYHSAFDGYSFAGQKDSLNQGPEDALHSFVLSDFSPHEHFPAEFQRFLRDLWPQVTSVAGRVERELLANLGETKLPDVLDADYGHMMSANYYPPDSSSGACPRLTEHPDVSLLTLFPFGVAEGFEYQRADGDWQALAPTNRVVAFAGELLEWLTSGRIRALTHRVARTPGERFSFSLFSLPRPEARITRVLGSDQGGNGLRQETISVEAYIKAHLSRWD